MQVKVIRGEGLNSNIFILKSENDEKILVIDLGLDGLQTNFALKKTLEKMTKKIDAFQIEVFLTHCHIDHILGNDNLAGFANVRYSASSQTAKHINEKDAVTLLSMYGSGEISYSIEKIYKDNEKISFEGADLEVIYAPGHTDGCAAIYDKKSKSLFSGDVVFAGAGCGRVDLPTGDRTTLITSLSKLADLELEHLYSGHGPDLHTNVKENIIAAKRMLEW